MGPDGGNGAVQGAWRTNNLAAGVEGGQEISNPIRYSYTINKINTVPSTSLLNPNAQQPFSGTQYITSIVHTKSESVGVYFVDTLKLGHLFELSAACGGTLRYGVQLVAANTSGGWNGDGPGCADQPCG